MNFQGPLDFFLEKLNALEFAKYKKILVFKTRSENSDIL